MKRVGKVVFGLVGALGVVCALSACGAESGDTEQQIGQVSLALAAVPADALCLKVNVVGTKSVSRSFALTPGQMPTLALTALPLGAATLTVDAYGVACASVTASSVPTWSSYSMNVNITPSPAGSITIILARGGGLNARVDFDPTYGGSMCPAGQSVCGVACVDTKSSSTNCGACGKTCEVGTACKNSTCLVKDGYECVTAADCVSNACKVYYRDEDGDGHGSAAILKSVCGSVAPAGFVATKDDCCDSGSDAALIFPGQSAFFTNPAVSCGKGWDYNCSGSTEPELGLLYNVSCKVQQNACLGSGTMWTSATVPECGATAQVVNCLGLVIDTGNGLICGSSNPFARVQSCH